MELYGKRYFDRYCGPLPYDRSHPEFLRFFQQVASRIADQIHPDTVMDVGCAKGFLVEALRDRGVTAFGIDVSQYAISEVRPDIRPWCRVASATQPLGGCYDLITCIEVLEHIGARDAKLALDNICSHADAVLFSSTPDDYYESSHVHVQPQAYWMSQFETRGFDLDRRFDASFVTRWAMLFRRSRPPRLCVAYYAMGSPSSACNLVRVTGPMSHLARAGRVTLGRGVHPDEGGWALTLDPLREADLLLLQREFACLSQVGLLVEEARRHAVPVVVELDDLLFDVPADHPSSAEYRALAPKCIEAIRGADAVTVPTAELAAEVARFNPRVRVLPNYLDDTVWKMVDPPARSDPITIGYAASVTHGPDIDAIREALLAIADRYGSHVRFRFLGCAPAWGRALAGDAPQTPYIDDYRWSYPQAITSSGIHIGLAPLRPSRFNAVKSHIKYLEYAAAGIAGVYADLEPYRRAVVPGVTGLVAGPDPERWYEAIRTLIEDEALRVEIARNAQADLRRNWLLSRNMDRWYDAYARILDRPRPQDRRTPTAASTASAEAPDAPLVSIVIPVHDQWSYTARCLERLGEHTKGVDHEIIVVDNGSTDGTRSSLQATAAGVRVITNPANEGFAKACNQGARAARGRYVVFLNNDTEVCPGWLPPLVQAVEREPAVAVAGGRLLFPDGRVEHAGVELRYASPYPITPANIGYGSHQDAARQRREVTAVTGACMLVRSEVFSAVGGFDEGYENGYEDVDLCLKVGRKGLRVLYVPESVVIHHGGSTPGRHRKERENLDLLHRRWMERTPPFELDVYTQARPAPADPRRPAVSVVVVAYDSLATIAPCLERLRLHTGPQDEIIVVDNASPDATACFLTWFETRYPDTVRVIRSERNLGFAGGTNLGLAQASGEYVCLLNPDVLVTPGWLEGLLAHLAADPAAGAVGPCSDYVAGRQRVDQYVQPDASEDIDALAARLATARAGMPPVETKLLIGFCLLARRRVLNELGGLDPDLFLGHDDLDLSLRLRDRGLRLLVASDVFVHHAGHVSFGRDPSRGMVLVQQSANVLYENLYRASGGNVPSGEALWDIGWFKPTTGLTSIVVLVHDRLEITRQCVAALYEQTHRDFELILVDNGSQRDIAGELAGLTREHANARYIRNERNEGYPYGCNQGLALAQGEFVVFLNNDVLVTRHWLGRLLALLTLHDKVGIVGPRTNYSAGIQHVDDPSYGGPGDLKRYADRWFVDHAGGFTSVPRIVGVCMVARRAVFDKVGGFDTGFGLGNFEDDDLCLRALLAGFMIAVADDVFVHHHGSATFTAMGLDYKSLMAQNWELFNHKWSHGRDLRATAADSKMGAFDPEWDQIPFRYEEIFHPEAPPMALGSFPPVRFLCIPDWTHAAWRPVVERYARAFRRDSPVGLTIRIEPPTPDLEQRAREEVAALLRSIGRPERDVPNIVFDTTPLPPRRRASLYAWATDYLACEGRRAGLYAREARACGLPVAERVSVSWLRRRARGASKPEG